MQQRIIGLDLARAYAIFGMYIVNFSFCFGSFAGQTTIEKFQALFIGNSTSIFIILAGMGLSLMSNKTDYTLDEKKKLRSIVIKRSWFLFAIGILLYSWWPGDILHFYGGYMHIAALLLFVPKRYYLWIGSFAIIIFHLLLFAIPIETGWDYNTTEYLDFWTIKGFLRNTLYNGWNSVFPWITFFMLGMWLGCLDWQKKATKKMVFLTGFVLLVTFKIVREFALNDYFDEKLTQYIMSDYLPPYLPFMAITAGFALMAIPICLYIGEKFPTNKLLHYLSLTGKMALTNYVIHLTLGMILLALLTGKTYTGYWKNGIPADPFFLFSYSLIFFIFSVIFSVVWSKRFKNGPIESLMRKFSD